MNEINYTFEKMQDAANAISEQKERFAGYDRAFLTEVISNLQGLQSNFAKEMVELLEGIELDNTAITAALQKYSATLTAASDEMYVLECGMTAAFKEDGDNVLRSI